MTHLERRISFEISKKIGEEPIVKCYKVQGLKCFRHIEAYGADRVIEIITKWNLMETWYWGGPKVLEDGRLWKIKGNKLGETG